MKHIIKLIFYAVTFMMITVISSAETFWLKDGNKVTGDIVSHEDGIYTVSTSFGIADIPDENIDKISDKPAETEDEVKEIRIAAKEIKRNFVPEYEDEKYRDPLYIAYHEAKTSAVALTASGAVMFGLGTFIAAISLPVYFTIKSIGDKISEDCCDQDTGNIVNNIGLAVLLPWFVAPLSLGFILLMACIAPWIYAHNMLSAWQSKYHVNMSMADADKLEFGLSISL